MVQAGRQMDGQEHALQMGASRKEHAAALEKLHTELKRQEVCMTVCHVATCMVLTSQVRTEIW